MLLIPLTRHSFYISPDVFEKQTRQVWQESWKSEEVCIRIVDFLLKSARIALQIANGYSGSISYHNLLRSYHNLLYAKAT